METTDRKIGQDAVLNGNKVKWSGDHYGWQSLASHKKLQINGDLNKGGDFVRNVNQLGRQALQVIQPALTLPGIKQTLEVLNEANENAKETYYNPQLREQQGPLVGSINQIVGGLNEGVNTVTNYWAGKAKDAGIHPDIGRWGSGAVVETVKDLAIGGAATKLTKVASKIPPAPGMRPALAIASAGNNTTLPSLPSPPKSLAPQVMEAVTAKNPEILALGGVKHGDDIITPEQAKHLTRRAGEVQQRVDQLPLLRDQLNNMIMDGADRKEIDNLRDRIESTKTMLHRKRSNVSVPTKEDPLYYKTTQSKLAKRQEELQRGLKTGEYLEQHHLFPKVVSSAFFDRMDWMINKGLAEADDLVLMNEIAIKLGRKPGDYKSGMLNMRQQPHNELHTAMDYLKDEFNEAEWAAKVGKAKTVDDLLVLWRDTIQDNVIPNAQNAISIDKLDDQIKSVSSRFSGSQKPSPKLFKQLSIH